MLRKFIYKNSTRQIIVFRLPNKQFEKMNTEKQTKKNSVHCFFLSKNVEKRHK